MSEGALLCVAPAVAAAVRDATGVVIRDLPLTPERVWRALPEEVARDLGPRRSLTPATRALVGSKAANLGVMARDLGLPVPPGFVISTAGAGLPGGRVAEGLDDENRSEMGALETAVGRRFGDARIRCLSVFGRANRCGCPG